MELKDLQKMTVTKLREEAVKIPGVQGAHGMRKDELVRVLAEAHGIPLGRTVAKPSTISEIKLQIRKLRVERDALSGSENEAARRRVRRQIRSLKRQTRRLARAAQTESPAGEEPAPEPAG